MLRKSSKVSQSTEQEHDDGKMRLGGTVVIRSRECSGICHSRLSEISQERTDTPEATARYQGPTAYSLMLELQPLAIE